MSAGGGIATRIAGGYVEGNRIGAEIVIGVGDRLPQRTGSAVIRIRDREDAGGRGQHQAGSALTFT